MLSEFNTSLSKLSAGQLWLEYIKLFSHLYPHLEPHDIIQPLWHTVIHIPFLPACYHAQT